MTNERKILYILGLIIIIGMIAIGSFSIGIYIGKQGWILKAPSITLPDQRPAQITRNSQDTKQGNVDPPRQPDLVGIVRNITTETIEIQTNQGIKTVFFSDDLVVLQQDSGKIKPSTTRNIYPSDRIAVIGEFQNAGKSLLGEIIIILEIQH